MANRSYLLAPLAVAGLLTSSLAGGCEADVESELRLGYEAVRVTESGGDVLIGGDAPGGYYTAYELQPSYPLTIESTAYLEKRNPTTRPSDTTGGGDTGTDAGDWKPAEVSTGRLTLAEASDCTITQPPTCRDGECPFALEMPGDGVCIASLTLTAPDGRVVSDCWGFGWDDGRGQSPEQREDRTEAMIQKRDDYCRTQ